MSRGREGWRERERDSHTQKEREIERMRERDKERIWREKREREREKEFGDQSQKLEKSILFYVNNHQYLKYHHRKGTYLLKIYFISFFT